MHSFREPDQPADPECVSADLRQSIADLRLRVGQSGSMAGSISSEQHVRQKFLDYIRRLEPSFGRFKQTKACRRLQKRIVESECINHHRGPVSVAAGRIRRPKCADGAKHPSWP